MPEATFKELFKKFLQDNMTPGEVRRFQAMASDRKNKQLLDRLLRDAYRRIPPLQSVSSESVSGEMDKLFKEVMVKARQENAGGTPLYPGRVVQMYRKYRVTLRTAVAILCIACIGLFCYRKYIAGTASEGTSIYASLGQRKSLTLPDGSTVILNAGSTLTLTNRFDNTDRVVLLSGEAYFDVAKNAHMPFVIHTSSMDIKVLGTAFDVRAYPDEAQDITSLINGKIEVTVKKDKGQAAARNYYLFPLQKLIVHKDKSGIALSEGPPPDLQAKPVSEIDSLQIDSLRVNRVVDQIPETAWTENKLFFDAEPLDEVMGKIEKWYGVTARLDNKAIETLHFTGSYQNESLTKVMDAIELANPEVHYRLENNDKLLIVY
jgi:ferric-dicitrate binding protein FerR (iron transport regulator)